MSRKTEITFIFKYCPDEQRCLEALRIVLNARGKEEKQPEQKDKDIA